MATVHRARGVLKIKRRKTTTVLGRANAMCVGIDDNPGLFPSPTVPTSAIKAQVVIVNGCETVAATHAKGSAPARDVQRNLLVGMLETDLVYIQGCADKSATWDQAKSTLLAGGVEVADVADRVKPILDVQQGKTPGSVILIANAAVLTAGLKGGYFFNWDSTVDGKTFTALPSTPKSKTSVANLTPLTTYGFRVSVTDSTGTPGQWSQIIYFLVH
jgi:hypothetical protein